MIDETVVKFIADTQAYLEGMNKMSSSTKGAAGEISAAFSEVKSKFLEVAAVVGVGFGVEKIVELGMHSYESAEQVQRLSETLGASTQVLQTVGLAATTSGASVESMNAAMTRLERSSVLAADGNKQSLEAFRALGFSAGDVAKMMKEPDLLIQQVTEHLAGMANSSTKVAIVNELMGRSAAENIATINKLGKEFAYLKTTGEELGVILSEVDKKKLLEVNEAMDLTKAATTGLGNQLGLALAPAIKEVSEDFTRLIASSEVHEALKTVGEAAKWVADNIGLIATVVKTLVELKVASWAMTAAAGIYEVGKALIFGAEAFSMLQKSFIVVAALIAAWNIGKYLYDNFLVVRLAWIDTVAAIQIGWEQIKQGFQLTVVDMKSGFASFLDAVAEGLNKLSGIGWLSEKLGGPSAVSAIKGVTDSLRDNSAAVDGIRTAYTSATDTINVYKEGQKQIAIVQASVDSAVEKTAAATEDAATKQGHYNSNIAQAAAEAQKAADDMLKLAEMTERLKGAIDPVQKAYSDYIANTIKLNALTVDAIKNGENRTQAEAALTAAMVANNAALDANLKKIHEQQDIVKQVTDNLQKEASTLGLSGRALFEQQEILKGAEIARQNFNNRIRDSIDLTPQEIAAIKATADAVYAQKVAFENSKAVMDDWIGIVKSGFESVGHTISDVLDGSIKSWKDFGKSLLDDAKKFIAQIVQEFIKLNAINPMLNQLFGGSGMPALPTGGGAGGGGFGSMLGSLGSLFGGGGASAGVGLAGNVAAGGIDLSAAAGAGGAAAGATAGAGGLMSSLGSMLPTIGIAIAGAALINSLTGGGLFGTSWKPSGSTASYGVGEGGGTVSSTVSESRKAPLFGLFGGSTHKTSAGPVDAAAQQSMQELFAAIKKSLQDNSAVLGVEVPNMISGSFKQVFDKKGNLTSQLSTVLGQTFKESIDEFKNRIQGENILAVVAKSAEDAQQIAQQFKGSGSTLLAGAQFLLAAQIDITKGNSLLGESLADTTKYVQSQVAANESLLQTYARLSGSAQMLQQAIDLMGTDLGKSKEDFVTFAAGIAQAAGGLPQAQALWTDFFKNFYSQSELAKQQAGTARTQANTALTGLGIDPTVSMADFRKMFEEQLPKLSADATAQWLQAAAALAAATNAQAAYDQTLSDSVQTTQAAAAAAQAAGTLTKAQQDYMDFMNSIRATAGVLTPYQKSMIDIQRTMEENIAKANELAQAAGQQAAAEGDLAQIHMAAAMQAAAAMAQLQQQGLGLVDQLYGGGTLGSINSEIARLQNSAHTATTSMSGFSSAITQTAQAATNSMDILLGALSPLNDQQKLQKALQGYQAGTVSESQVLEIGRRLYASSQQYNALFAQVEGMHPAGAAAAQGPTYQAGGVGSTSAGMSEADQARLAQLIKERDQIQAQQRTAEAKQLAATVAQIATAQGESYAQVAEDLHFNLSDLAKDLGMSQEELSKYLDSMKSDKTMTVDSIKEARTVIGKAVNDSATLLNASNESNTTRVVQAVNAITTAIINLTNVTSSNGSQTQTATQNVNDALSNLNTAIQVTAAQNDMRSSRGRVAVR